MEDLVTTDWLAAHLREPSLAVLDCSWHLPAAKRDARSEYLAGHIPGALFCDLDQLSDRQSPLPHMLPAAPDFAARAGAMGIGNGSRVVCYDAAGLFSAARVWWMFKAFGHAQVSVLDGGLPKWMAEGRPLAIGDVAPPPAKTFMVQFNPSLVASKEDMRRAAQVADARSPARFRGEEPEPRPGVKPGHMPGSRNIHYAALLNPNGTLKPVADLAKIFSDAGIDVTKPVATTCGSGVTAAILSLALSRLGAARHALYDGSWAEWGAASDTQIEAG